MVYFVNKGKNNGFQVPHCLLSKRRCLFVWITRPKILIMLTVLSFMLLLVTFWMCKSLDNSYSSADNGEEFKIFPSHYFDSWPGYKVEPTNVLKKNIPIIVWWTDGGSLYPHSTSKFNPHVHLTCPNGAACYSTSSREQDLQGDARTRGFLFYGTDVDPMDLPLPRLTHHEWALIHEESPLNNYILVHHPMVALFNHTSTFKRESDYPLSTQAIHHTKFLLNRQPISTAWKNKEKTSRRLAPIVYVQSHCDVPSDRDSYVKELMKHIDVDSYGSCLHNKELPKNLQDPASTFEHDDFYQLLSVYKFTLAFENAYCDDYMTEKIMRPLHIGVVPIYKGSPVIQDWMPNNHSIILVDNFKSPKDLAEFIKKLDENDEEYEKYLEFKKSDMLQNNFLKEHLVNREWSEGSKDFFRGFECHVCHQLNVGMKMEKMHSENSSTLLLPPRVAQHSHLSCLPPERLDVGSGVAYSWPEIDWTSLYWEGLDKAKAVQAMLEAGERDTKQFPKYHYDERLKHMKKKL